MSATRTATRVRAFEAKVERKLDMSMVPVTCVTVENKTGRDTEYVFCGQVAFCRAGEAVTFTIPASQEERGL